MGLVDILIAILQGIVQGITEWLPISSTGHMLLVDQFVTMNGTDKFFDVFKVVVQLGSIMAVVVLFFHKLNPFSSQKTAIERKDTISLWFKVAVASIPAAIIALAFDDIIEGVLSGPLVIATTLIVYGVLFILLENRKKQPKINNFKELNYQTAILIGAFQMLALIPGTSRSGATILGAVFLGASRYVAAEFSFFMAIPMMFGASAMKLLTYGLEFNAMEWAVLLTGTIVSFLVSLFAIKFLMGYIKKHDFKVFGYYRIVLGAIVLLYFLVIAPR